MDYKANERPKVMLRNDLGSDLVEIIQGKGRHLLGNDLFRTLIEYLPDQIYLKDRKGRFIMCNRQVALNAGCETAEEMIGKTDFDFYDLERAQSFFTDEQSVINSANALINHEEHYMGQNTDNVRWNLTTKVPIKDNAGTVVGLMGINRDITEMKNAVLDREKTMDDLLHRNQDLTQFTHMVSHKVRPPLANIMALAELLSGLSSCDDEDLKTILPAIRESAKKLDAIIHDLNNILDARGNDL